MSKMEKILDLESKATAILDERGHENLSDTPVALPLRFQRPQNILDRVRALVAHEMSRLAEAQGFETFEEADDFDVDDDPDLKSPYELTEDQYYHEFTRDNGRPDSEERPADSAGSGTKDGVQPNGQGTAEGAT
jgi:hypothetical protein